MCEALEKHTQACVFPLSHNELGGDDPLLTVISYGNVAPKTFSGRAFCVLFAVFGIPLTLLAIADLGKFLSEIIFEFSDRIHAEIKRRWRQNTLRSRAFRAQKHRSSTYRHSGSKSQTLHEEDVDFEPGLHNSIVEVKTIFFSLNY
ncbi:unnamed protein product [Gongylonema pulchrum]|uniref:Ion_trans_2 domain-containing protein n=1 Tax=Gongylonema pulchrum TaxID=637853 RepID=A0A183END8_9BILA|nr:unnamed protein product [Gongylonema pulchrum]